MRVHVFLLTVFVILFLSEVHAGGFRDLEREFAEYDGSDYFLENIRREEPPSEEKRDVRAFEELGRMKKVLAEKKARGIETMEDVILKNPLFRPEPEIWARIRDMDTEGMEGFLREDFSLENLLSVALRNNPDIKKAYREALATVERYDQVSNLDEILNQYAVFTKNLDITIGRPIHKKPLMLDFPFPGMLALKGDIVQRDVELAGIALERTVQDVITRVKETYYETIYLYHAVDITREVIGLLERLRKVINTVYVTGRTSLNDVVKIQMEIDRISNDLTVLEENKKTMQTRLNKLLDISEDFMPADLHDLEPLILDYTKEALFRRGEEDRSEIKALNKELERMALLITLAEKRFYPDFTPGFTIFENRVLRQVGTYADQETFPSRPMIRGMDWFGANDAYIRETRLRYQTLMERLRSLKNRTVDEINQALFRYENARRFKLLYEKKLVPRSRLTVDITEALYVTGRVDFMDLINSQELFLEYSLKLKEAIKEMNIEASRIERLIGSSIPVRKEAE